MSSSTTSSPAAGHVAHSGQLDPRTNHAPVHRPFKVTMIGAGSFFTPRVVCDIFQIYGYLGGEIALVDIDAQRLDRVRRLVQRFVAEHGLAEKVTVTASTDRCAVLANTDYVISCVEVAGLAAVRPDFEIPLEYGVDQCIGDTIGPGGLFKALRTVPVWLEILRDIERLAPGALVMNYTNPMNVLCLASARTSPLTVVGLCHSVQGTGKLLAKRAGVPYPEMIWECAGINHLAWFTRLEHQGRDLYPVLKDYARASLAGTPINPEDAGDLIRMEMMLQFGAFITESSGHLSEYLPYFRKRKDLLAKYCGPDRCKSGYDGETGFYANNWPTWRQGQDQKLDAVLAGSDQWDWSRSHEYASQIIEAIESGVPCALHGNISNGRGGERLISNLADDACVEVKIYADRTGLNPCRFGALPKVMAHLCASNLAMFDLAADACIHRDRELAIQALMLDPLTQAVCEPAEIRQMANRMFEGQQALLPGF
jgi:alpha-galactosidase